MTQQADSEAYPIHRARFQGGRTWHRVQRPADWHDLLRAKCGRTGYGASGHATRAPRNCPGCYPAP